MFEWIATFGKAMEELGTWSYYNYEYYIIGAIIVVIGIGIFLYKKINP